MPNNTKRPIRALVVDDNEDAAETFCRLLQSMGCGATFVTNPTVAIDASQAIEADIVFLDLGMPRLNGYELARMFRRRYRDAPLRLVAVTAYGSSEHRVMSRESGFDAHVQKPIDLAVVESMLATLFRDER
jgi:two-component system, chemotaxis family, CheB/CheR fusion protein